MYLYDRMETRNTERLYGFEYTSKVHLVLNETPRKGKNKVTWVVYAMTLGHPSTDDTRVIALACSWTPF